MFEIKGNVGKAVCYAKVVEEEAIEQLRRMCGGNHFIEIDEAVGLNRGIGVCLEAREVLIRDYKEQRRRKEIQAALQQLKWEEEKKESTVPEGLCWLEGRYLEEYLHDVEICQSFAKRNREKMAEAILERTGQAGSCPGRGRGIINVIQESVDVIDVMKPVYNFKAS